MNELKINAIYKHFKHTEDGLLNNYMYAVMGISKPVKNIIDYGTITNVRSSENKEMYFIRFNEKEFGATELYPTSILQNLSY